MEKEQNTKNEESLEEEIENIEKPSYTYWKRESDTPFSNDFKPQKSETVLSDNTKTSSGNAYGSVWNTAGTWEEKHLSKTHLQDFFNESLKKYQNFDDTFKIGQITSYSGDVR